MQKVSVIVPIYNVEKFLKECLDSLVNQTLKDIEIICVDDGSTDSSGSICDEYAKNDARIKVIHKQNAGYGSAINTGIDAATGKYLAILESDDFADKKIYEDLFNIAENYQADVIKCDWFAYWGETKFVEKVGSIPKYMVNKPITIADVVDLLKNKTTIWGGIYLTKFIKENNIRCLETAGASYQDTSFNFKALCLAKKIVLTEKAYVYYRQDNMNSSVKNRGKIFCIDDEYNELTKFLNEHPEIKPIVNDRKMINEYKAGIWNLLRMSEEFRLEYLEKFSERFAEYAQNNELSEGFYNKISKNEVELLVNNKEEYYKIIEKREQKKLAREKRKKNFSLKINSSRMLLRVFGKQIINIEF